MVIQTVAHEDPYTKPAEPRINPGDVDKIIEASAKIGGEESVLREAARQDPLTRPSPHPHLPPRKLSKPACNAPCSCASGDKFKRCCGKNALGIFGQARAA